jgi:glutathione S-transferase
MTARPYRLLGANASPYSMKMRALLRYRRLAFIWEPASPHLTEAFKQVKPAVVPVLVYPDGTYGNDSTPLAHDLERRHPGVRSVVPTHAADAFYCDLLEDMADEWGTKCMFHYRWWYEPDRAFASTWVIGDRWAGQLTQARSSTEEERSGPAANPVAGSLSAATLDAAERQFRDRQVGRMALVGVTALNRPAIEATYQRVLAIFEAHLASDGFLFGTRPSLADFAWFGQLWTLAMDPTPGGAMRSHAPRLLPWLLRLDDASGVEGAWRVSSQPSAWVVDLLRLAGESYLPFLQANADALAAGRDEVRTTALGHEYVQAPFRYQAKCYATLRRRLATLPPATRAAVDPVLEATGCLRFLA